MSIELTGSEGIFGRLKQVTANPTVELQESLRHLVDGKARKENFATLASELRSQFR